MEGKRHVCGGADHRVETHGEQLIAWWRDVRRVTDTCGGSEGWRGGGRGGWRLGLNMTLRGWGARQGGQRLGSGWMGSEVTRVSRGRCLGRCLRWRVMAWV